MSCYKILSIIKSEFSSSMDDTLINRLAESLFCEDLYHDKFWIGIDIESFSIDNLIDSIATSQFSHPNIIRVIISMYNRDNKRNREIESIIICCLNHEDPDYSYTGLWCCLKLLKEIDIDLVFSHIFTKYLNNNNVIFQPIFEEIIINIYLKSIFNGNKNISDAIESSIINDIASKVFLLEAILYTNATKDKLELESITNQMEHLDIKTFLSYPQLIYCYILCPQSSIAFNNIILDALEKSKKVFQSIKYMLHSTNGSILKILLKKSTLAFSLWSSALETIATSNLLLKEFISLGEIDADLIPDSLFLKLFNKENFSAFKNVIFDERKISFVTDYFNKTEYRSIFSSNEIVLTERYIISIFSQNNAINALQKELRTIFELLKLSIFDKNCQQDLLIELFLKSVKHCLEEISLDRDCKIGFIGSEINFLIKLQRNFLRNYIDSESMVLLSSEPIRLAKEVCLMLLDNEGKCEISAEGETDITELLKMSIATTDLYDYTLYEYILFCALSLNSSMRETSFISIVDKFVNNFLTLDITISLNDFMIIKTFYERESISSVFIDQLINSTFKKNVSSDTILSRLRSLNKDAEGFFESFRFETDFCSICKENIDELIEDISISAAPLECFGD